MRKIKVIAILLVLIMVFAGCNLIEVNPERDMQRIVAKVEGQTITKEEYAAYVDYYVYNYQIQAYFSGQAAPDFTNPDTLEALKEASIESAITQKILEIKAKEYDCYDFTQEELDAITEEYNNDIEEYRASAKNSVEGNDANAGLSQEELDKLIEEEFNSSLVAAGKDDKEASLEALKNQKAIDKLREIVTETEDPIESELQAVYDQKVAEQEASYAENPSLYDSALSGDQTIYYNLPNTRQSSQILISLPDDIQEQINALRADGDEDGANALREEELAKIKEKADEVYALAVEGQDFAELIDEYGEDPGMKSKDYYPVVKDVTQFASEYMDALFALENVGDFTEPVASDFGYHIILYYGEVKEGAVAFEDVRDDLKAEILENRKNEIYQETITAWREEAKVKIYKSRLNMDLG